MSYNNIFSDSSHLSHNRILKDPVKVNLGDKLNKVRDRKHPQKEIAIYDVNDKPTFQNVSDYGLSLLDTLSQSDLKASLLETNEEAIRLTSDTNNEINFFTGTAPHGASNLRMQIKNLDTIIKNNLLVDNIKDITGNQSVNITSAQLTLQRPKITFRDSAYTNRGYTQAQNSGDYDGDNTTGYLEWYTGLNARCAYMGLGGSNDLVGYNGKSISLALEQGCNFRIAEGATEIFKVSVEDDIITANYNFRINVSNNDYALFVANNSNQACLYSGKQYPGRIPSGLLVQGFFEGADTNQERCALKINNYSNGGYRPVCYNSANQSKIIFCSDNLHTSDSHNFIVDSQALFTADTTISTKLISPIINTTNIRFTGETTDAITLSSSDITCSKDVNIQGTSVKLNFNSNNYLQNDGNNHLNLYINSSKNFVANTGDSVSTYDFKINSISKLKISDSKMDIDSDLSISHRKKITFLNAFHSNNGTSIGQNDLCNEINGAKSTNSQGENSIYGHMRLSSGWGSSKSSIDLYGFGEVTSNRIITTIENVEVSEVSRYFHDIKISARTQHIYPQADITYDLGVADDNEWRNVYTENIFVAGQQHHSDRRIKDNIIDLPNDKGLSFIQKIRPVQFTYKKSTQQRKHWGFIAQEIREVVGSDNYSIWGEQRETEFKKQHIAPSEFLGPIVKSIQELYDIVQL